MQSVDFASKEKAHWHYPTMHKDHIWGFRLSIFAWETESEEWVTVPSWASVLIRTYTLAEDGFTDADVAEEGVECDENGQCTLTFADIKVEGLDPPSLDAPPDEVGKWRLEVSVLNLDMTESRKMEHILINQG